MGQEGSEAEVGGVKLNIRTAQAETWIRHRLTFHDDCVSTSNWVNLKVRQSTFTECTETDRHTNRAHGESEGEVESWDREYRTMRFSKN
jgi:hypothetical protein